MTTVWPSSRTELRRNERISAPERESRFPVGSSAKMMSGRPASARAQATRCCWPPESWLGRWVSRPERPTVSTTLSSQARSTLRPAMSIGRVMFSSAVRVGSRLNAWKMKPMWSRRSWVSCLSLRPTSSVSPIVEEPEETVSRPAMQCINVDLPEPEGPMMAVYSPSRKSTVTFSRATTRVSPSPYTLLRPTARAAARPVRTADPVVVVTALSCRSGRRSQPALWVPLHRRRGSGPFPRPVGRLGWGPQGVKRGSFSHPLV